jgi:peptidyl-prolyl cis-trans isomerase D
MLRFFRGGGIAQIFVGGIVVAIILAFVFTGQFGSATLSDRCAVRLDEACVEIKEFNAAYGLAVRASGLELTPEGTRQIKRLVLDGLAERELLLRDAKRFGLSVSEEEIDLELMEGRTRLSLPAMEEAPLSAQLRLCKIEAGGCAPATTGIRILPVKADGQFNVDLYKRVVRSYTGRGQKQFKDMQRREIVAARMRQLIKSRARVSEEEAFMLWERERSQATVRTVQARGEWFARYVVQLSDTEVDAWTMENKDAVDTEVARVKENFTDGCPMAAEIFVPTDPVATDEEKVLARGEIEEAGRRLKGGEKFELLARELSEGETATLGGELGCLGEHYGPGAQDLLKALGEVAPGKVTPVVESVRGFHLLKSLGPLPTGQGETTARHVVARQLATRAKGKELAERFTKELIEAVPNAESLQTATEELVARYAKESPLGFKQAGDEPAAVGDDMRPKVEISSPFNVLQRPIKTALEGDVASLAFALAKPDDLHPKPIETSQGAAVMQLKSKEPATREQFADDKQRLVSQLRQAKASEALGRYVDDLREQAGDQLTFDEEVVQSTKPPKDGEEQDES